MLRMTARIIIEEMIPTSCVFPPTTSCTVVREREPDGL